MRRKRRVKKRFKRFFLLFVFVLLLFVAFNNFYVSDIDKIEIKKIDYDNKTLVIRGSSYFGNMECSVTDNVSKAKWKRVWGNVCRYKIESFGNYDIYFRNKNGVKKIDNVNKVFYSSLRNKKKDYYLAVGSSEKILYNYLIIGKSNPSFKSSDDSIVSVKNGKIYGKSIGTAKVSLGDEKINVVVTDLIDKIPKEYNYHRYFIPCNAFSKKEAALLDKILFDRVKTAGEKTRAGVVAAARFLTLEFPYRINYFSENGRLGPPYNIVVDGEGRYYHKGLYLSEDKYSDIDPAYKGPKMWGCSMYSKPSKADRQNGLDCSGFTTWAVLNGGFDIGDLAAHGGDDSAYNLNDIGKEVELTYDVAMSNKIKAGDLLGEVTVSEGHSAIVVGVDDDNYYVAESLWIYPYGVNINTYSKEDFTNHFETVNLMDSYYKKQGNYTAMWY